MCAQSLVMSNSCDPMNCSSGHGIFQARILEWVAISYSRGSSWPRDQTGILCVSSLPLGHLGGPGDFFKKKRNDLSFGFSSCLLTRWTGQTTWAFCDTFKSDNFHVRLLIKLLFSNQVFMLMLFVLLLQCAGVFQLAFQMGEDVKSTL